jgi:fatty-acyl-CoA synthase
MVPTMSAIEKERCTALLGVPTIFLDLMRHERRHEYNLKSLKLAVLSGAPVSSALIRQIEHELNIPHVTQVYGQTEAARIASTSNLELGDITQRYESMGKCVPHREIKIIDIISKRVVPLGEPGEICTRSFRTMRGYWSNTIKTQEAIDDAQWLHTGDIGILDANGCVYLRGRIKDVIIRGGVNIFPLEIEARLEQHPAIERAQVFGIPDERLGELVCAMVVAKCVVDIDELRCFLSLDLAYFKIPTNILIVTGFPTTSTGKIQKFKLAEIMMQHLSTEKKEC